MAKIKIASVDSSGSLVFNLSGSSSTGKIEYLEDSYYGTKTYRINPSELLQATIEQKADGEQESVGFPANLINVNEWYNIVGVDISGLGIGESDWFIHTSHLNTNEVITGDGQGYYQSSSSIVYDDKLIVSLCDFYCGESKVYLVSCCFITNHYGDDADHGGRRVVVILIFI